MQLNGNAEISSIIVAGGKASRIGGIDKTMLPLGINGGALLTEVVAASPGKKIVVGKPRNIDAEVIWIDDQEVGGGPAAGIWSGLAEVETDYVFLVAGDQQLTAKVVEEICSAALGRDGAWALRPDGQGQPLLACVKTNLIRTLLEPTKGLNQSPLRLMEQLDMFGVKVNDNDLKDIDTWLDVQRIVKEQAVSDVTPIWLAKVAATLGIPATQIPVEQLLDLTREVAHNVERKSAPLTTYLIGLAEGKTDLSVAQIISLVNDEVSNWPNND